MISSKYSIYLSRGNAYEIWKPVKWVYLYTNAGMIKWDQHDDIHKFVYDTTSGDLK
jgi:hypothetical protein